MTDLIPRLASYPLLTPGGLDYTEKHTYEIEQTRDRSKSKDTIGILHRICGDNLVSQLILNDKALFACVIVSPWCAFRCVETAVGTPTQTDGTLQLEQCVLMQTEEFSFPVMFQPLVVTHSEVNNIVASQLHGLDPIWFEQSLNFPVGAMIALQPFWNAKTVMQSILQLKRVKDDSLRSGSFEVKEVNEKGFYFCVEVSSELFDSLRNPESFEHRDSIYSMALTQGFEILRAKYGERDVWSEQQNLKLLYGMLKERELPTWDEVDFLPNQVVAALHPHVVKSASETDLY